MQTKTVLAAIAALSLSTSALADAGHSHDNKPYGVPGDPKKSARVVQVAMKEQADKMLFVPNRIEVRKGEQVRFVMKNHGASDHEFVLGTQDEIAAHAEQMKKNPDMEHDDPNSKRLTANQNGDIVWRFTNAGRFEFACLIPGHMESGMVGTIIVK
ncbi:MAG TPA: cupredoxin family protein [Ancylobacter sp.]